MERSVEMSAEAAISSVVELLGEMVIQQARFTGGDSSKAHSLKEDFKRIESYLETANKISVESKLVPILISGLRDEAEAAEDALEKFIFNGENSRSMGFLKRYATLVESIRVRLDAIDKLCESWGLKDFGEVDDSPSRFPVNPRRREQLVGMEFDVDKLLGSVLDHAKTGLIVLIKGVGGIGKSALARTIYNHSDVMGSDRFQCRAWIEVSSESTPQETMKHLILQLSTSEEEEQSLLHQIKEITNHEQRDRDQELQELLRQQLKGKPYFIILDNIGTKDHLMYLIAGLPDSTSSKLLVTTRDEMKIPEYDHYVHTMRPLDLDNSFQLLLKHAFLERCPHELESTGRQIVDKCGGIPLAITVVGGLLMETPALFGWEQVLYHLPSNISQILEYIYHNLPPKLKSCFLCLAFFNEDATIPVKRLLHIWVGNGLIQQGERTVEETGRAYLDELINRNMVQIKDLALDGRVKNCHLHHLLREVFLTKAEKEMRLGILKKDSDSYQPHRHRVAYGEDPGQSSTGLTRVIRSLSLRNDEDVDEITLPPSWTTFLRLRTLDLDGFNMSKFPDVVRSLIRLKYLRIRRRKTHDSEAVLMLPNWMDQLNLEVLDMEGENVEFPDVALKMKRLHYLSAYCVRGPMSIDNWDNIDTLKYIRHEDWMRCKPSSSCPVRKLGLVLDSLKQSPHEVTRRSESLHKLNKLEELHLRWNLFFPIDTAIVTNLLGLTTLKLRGKLNKCPDANTFPPYLQHLALDSTHMDEDPMPELGKLPNLLTLKLSRRAYRGESMQVLDADFPCLEALSLRSMRRLRSINIQRGMPKLKQFRIHHCPALETKNLPEGLIASLVHNT